MYAKIFRQIFESSIAEKPELRFTFMDMLVLADMDGVVDMTHEAIARITNRPLELIRSTISDLEGPDPRSRTPDNAGARLKRLDDHRDWGWVIINYDTFRAMANEEQRRIKTLLRVKKHRESARKVASVTSESVTQRYTALPSVSVSVSASVCNSEVKKEVPKALDCPEFRQAWNDFEQHRIQIRKKMTPLASTKLLSRLELLGVQRSIAAINHSIENGWQGIFEPKEQSTTNSSHGYNNGKPPVRDYVDIELRKLGVKI